MLVDLSKSKVIGGHCYPFLPQKGGVSFEQIGLCQ